MPEKVGISGLSQRGRLSELTENQLDEAVSVPASLAFCSSCHFPKDDILL